MNITILGASGKTGSEIVKQALEAGHSVTALVRRADALAAQPNLNVLVGDVTNARDVAKASKGAHAVVSALGAMGGSLMTDAVKAVIAASKETGVKRFVLMSSFAVRKDQLSGGTKFVTGLLMGKVVKDKSASEALLRKSSLDWTIVYPTGLTNNEKGARVRVVSSSETVGMKNKIARADVAAWILDELKANKHVKAEALITA
ncbi:MAG TPA: NAD(P)-binding oxidoreductase [Candidatus Saccharimonadales bacterium]|nr:NAD(P)-binding oxidoreductase [Candidatus Saccharimonadales bacterium]